MAFTEAPPQAPRPPTQLVQITDPATGKPVKPWTDYLAAVAAYEKKLDGYLRRMAAAIP